MIVLALLRFLYRDVRPEDFTPQHSGARSRVDYLIRDSGIVVETKMTRKSMTDKTLGDELLVDWGRYPKHPDCRAIFALVYDPTRQLSNPEGLANDLSQDSREPTTRVLIVR